MNKMRLFLVHLTVNSGDVELAFHQTLLAPSPEEAETAVRFYLQTFSSDAEPLGYLWYSYERGAFALRCQGFEQADADYVCRHLAINS